MMAEVQIQVPSRPRKSVLLRDKKEKTNTSPIDDAAETKKWKFVDKHELHDPHKDFVTFNKRPDTIKEFSKSKQHRYDEKSDESQKLRASRDEYFSDPQTYTSLKSSMTLSKTHLSPKGKSPRKKFESWDNNFHYLSEFLTDEEKKILISELEEIGIPRPPSAIWRPATVPPAPPLSAAHIGLFHLNKTNSDDNLNNMDSPLTQRDVEYQGRPHSQSFTRQRPERSPSFEGNSSPFLPPPANNRRLERVPSFSELPLSAINNMLKAPTPPNAVPAVTSSAQNMLLEQTKRLERTGSVSDMLVRPRPRASTLPERLLEQPLPPLHNKEFRLDLPPSSPLKHSTAMLSPSSTLRASKKLQLDSIGLLSVGFEPEPEPTGRELMGRTARGNQFVLEVQELTEVPTDFGPSSSSLGNGSSHLGAPLVVVTAPSGSLQRSHTPTGNYLNPTSKSRATTANRARSASKEKKTPPNLESSLPRIGTELRPFMYKEKFDTLMSNFSKAVAITDISDEEWKRITQSESTMTGADSPHSQNQEPSQQGL